MRILLFSPMGLQHPESGVAYLVANYLNSILPEVSQLQCNGAFSLCDRDAESNWRRSFSACAACALEQRQLSDWGELRQVELSTFLQGEDVDATKRWVHQIDDSELEQVEYYGDRLFDWCRTSFQNRVGSRDYDPQNIQHVQHAKRLVLSAARMKLATRRVQNKLMPDLSLVVSGADYLTRTFVEQSTGQGRPVSIMRWNLHDRVVQIFSPDGKESIGCELLIENVTTMRSDPNTWPKEVLEIVEEIASFLGLSQIQLELPIAQ